MAFWEEEGVGDAVEVVMEEADDGLRAERRAAMKEGVVAARGDGREMKVMEMMKRQTVEETDAD